VQLDPSEDGDEDDEDHGARQQPRHAPHQPPPVI
jgi:hypothetical protein